MTYHSETLAHEELVEITGSSRYGGPVAWLKENEWKHHKSRPGAQLCIRDRTKTVRHSASCTL